MTVHSEVEIVDDAGGLVLRRVVVGPLATNCWIVIDARDRRAIIVDPGDEPHRILDARAGLDPSHVQTARDVGPLLWVLADTRRAHNVRVDLITVRR